MADYGRQFFDQCLVTIISELSRAEEKHPDWPDDLAHAARIVSDNARELLSVTTDIRWGGEKENNRILKKAAETGAITLRFLLNAKNGLRCEQERVGQQLLSIQAFD